MSKDKDKNKMTYRPLKNSELFRENVDTPQDIVKKGSKLDLSEGWEKQVKRDTKEEASKDKPIEPKNIESKLAEILKEKDPAKIKPEEKQENKANVEPNVEYKINEEGKTNRRPNFETRTTETTKDNEQREKQKSLDKEKKDHDKDR